MAEEMKMLAVEKSKTEEHAAEEMKNLAIGTKLIALKLPAPEVPIDPVMPAIYKTTMYQISDVNNVARQDYTYARHDTPNSRELELVISSIEGGEDALVFPGGLPAITATLMSFLRPGDHVVAQSPIYSGTHVVLKQWLPAFNIEVTNIPPAKNMVERMRAATKENTKMYLGETIANPTLAVLDLAAFGKLGQEKNIMTFVDATFSTPINQNPLKHGIDISMHSCTKHMCGHSDILAGCCVFGKKAHYERVYLYRKLFTAPLDPTGCYNLLRSLKTLHVRMERHNENALTVAQFLEKQPKVKRVLYPGLPSHPDHQLAKSIMKGYGGVVTFSLQTEAAVKTLVTSLKLFHLGTSLGGVEGLVEQVCTMSHGEWAMTEKERQTAGIDRGMVRMSVGIEDIVDILQDLQQAFDKVSLD